MNILFIFPLNEPYDTIINANATPWKSKLNKDKTIKKTDCVYPTGLLSISSYLKKQHPDADIKIVDFNVIMNRVAKEKTEGFKDFSRDDFYARCFKEVESFSPDIIGISTLFCSNYGDLKSLSQCIKTIYPDCFTFCGGHLSSAVYPRIFQDEMPLDAICFGEGELPIADLVKSYKTKTVQEYIAGDDCWITPEKLAAAPGFTPDRRLIVDLDEIPTLDLSVLMFPEEYFNSSRYFFVIDSQEAQREIFIFSTRGCPHHCVFCASQNVHGHKIRSYSIDRIKSDITHFNKEYGITRFVFYDDHFLSKKKQAIEVLDFIAENNFTAEIPTPAFFSIDRNVAAAMRRAGIKEVNITIESGNEDTLKNIMHKPASLKRAEEAVANLHREGITAISNILIGLPGETHESIEKGLEYLKTTEINWFQCFVTAPLPGSELYDICAKNHYFTDGDDIMVMDFKRCVISTPEFTPEYIEKKAYEMNLTLNFVNNYDMRAGNYARALKLFERILTSVIDTHAFAYYFASECCRKLGIEDKFELYKSKYEKMTEKYSFWQEWSDFYKLPQL